MAKASRKNPTKKTRAPAGGDVPFAPPDWPVARGIVMVKVAEITPHPKNPRTHPEAQLVDIGAAFDEFGVTSPPILDENNRLMAGEGRWLAAKKKGIEELPCIVATGWSESKKLRFMVADNRLPMLAGFDDTVYRAVLAAIRDEGLPLDAIGFDDAALAAALKTQEPPAQFPAFGSDIATEHECPKCGYKWSGASAARPEEPAPPAPVKPKRKKKKRPAAKS